MRRPAAVAGADHRQRALDVLPQRRVLRLGIACRIEERQGFVQQRRVLRGEEVLGQR
jgi:hypothetical protein